MYNITWKRYMETYLLARDLNGVPIGRHQFFVILTGDEQRTFRLRHSSQTLSSRNLGSQFGLVLGAQNIASANSIKHKFNRLIFVPFNKADLSCAVEFFSGQPSVLSQQFGYKQTEGVRIKPRNGFTEHQLAQSILSSIDHYIVNERNEPIAYPPPWFGKNSNSWTNSILDIVPADLPTDVKTRRKITDFQGADAAHDVRIHQMYFKGLCQPCAVQNPAYR